MALLQDLPIGRKLRIVARLSVLIALGVALLTIFVTEVTSVVRRADEDGRMLSEMVADNAISPLRFDDPQVARRLLGTLRHHDRVAAALIVKTDGSIFADYPAGLRDRHVRRAAGRRQRDARARPGPDRCRCAAERDRRHGDLGRRPVRAGTVDGDRGLRLGDLSPIGAPATARR